MNRRIEFALKNVETNYYLTNEECGFFNSFTRLTDAEKACKEVSKIKHFCLCNCYHWRYSLL